jgi:hypothetical protein
MGFHIKKQASLTATATTHGRCCIGTVLLIRNTPAS